MYRYFVYYEFWEESGGPFKNSLIIEIKNKVVDKSTLEELEMAVAKDQKDSFATERIINNFILLDSEKEYKHKGWCGQCRQSKLSDTMACPVCSTLLDKS